MIRKMTAVEVHDNPISPQKSNSGFSVQNVRNGVIKGRYRPNALPDDWKCSDNTWSPGVHLAVLRNRLF